MTLPLDDAVATELPRERNRPATTGSRQPQKAGVACHWLPSGKCMISPPNRTAKGVACYWLPSGKCMISPPNGGDGRGCAGEAGTGGMQETNI
jgi:hypothetical protein